ncbi:hypothetical protein ACLKA7_005527 [Drosophila subpalustris]
MFHFAWIISIRRRNAVVADIVRCTGRHHTLIHVEKEKEAVEPPKPSEESTRYRQIWSTGQRKDHRQMGQIVMCYCRLRTLQWTTPKVPLKFRAFWIQGSPASFISPESAAQLLRLPRQKVHVKVNGLASSRITEVTTAMFICLRSRLDSQVKYNVQVYILPRAELQWKLFVSNRISKILETSETSQWRHVATADNWRIIQFRGLGVNKLSSSELWWHGPQWLQAAESKWPTAEIDIGSTTEVSNEMKTYVQRFVRNCKVLRCERRAKGLSVDELSNSLRSVTRMLQLECFTAD